MLPVYGPGVKMLSVFNSDVVTSQWKYDYWSCRGGDLKSLFPQPEILALFENGATKSVLQGNVKSLLQSDKVKHQTVDYLEFEAHLSRTVTFTVLAPYNAAPHNRYQPHPAEPAQHTTCSNTRLGLLKMGMMIPETCWKSIDNKHLTVASCWFSISLHNLLTMHGHRNLKLEVIKHFIIQLMHNV